MICMIFIEKKGRVKTRHIGGKAKIDRLVSYDKSIIMPSIIFIRVTVQYKRKQDGRPLYTAAGSHGLLCSADSSSCTSLSPSGTNMILRAM